MDQQNQKKRELRAVSLAAQKQMAEWVSLKDEIVQPIKQIAGVDMSNTPFDPEQMVFGAVVVASYPSLAIVHTATQANRETFPYIPGLLGFREVPTFMRACNRLPQLPDILMVDGHGVSHPRGLGVASHLGVVLDIPTIGVAKSILVGSPAEPLAEEAGSMVPLLWKGNEIGMVVRTKKRCAPLIVSAGHQITLKTAVSLVMGCLRGRRLPEPIRYAHLAANACRRDFQTTSARRSEP